VRDLDPFARHLSQARLQLDALRRARRVGLDRLVLRARRAGETGGAHDGDCRLGPVRVTHVEYEVEGWGVGRLWLDGGRLLEHDLPIQVEQRHEVPHALADRFRAYFRGAHDDFADVELDLDWCTPFQRELLDTLRVVPYGEVVTYGELAALAGRPGAARAAGTFCARNRFALVVPCHRVVAAEGLGGYGSTGVATKLRLLRLEGVAV
jgi:methylated-DNA-[protein]-cysteine S-methyltransferase